MTYYYQWKQKEAQKLAVEGNGFWSRSIITTTLLPFLAWYPIPVPRLLPKSFENLVFLKVNKDLV